ncbi:MAG: hypothetical protein OXC93_16490 [Rhodospirillaceae bacterium]|nr:hypothetical protein [Rhodospirillaceae bacterium]
MKGYAVTNRVKRKDACDIYYSMRKFPDGSDSLVQATRPLLDVKSHGRSMAAAGLRTGRRLAQRPWPEAVMTGTLKISNRVMEIPIFDEMFVM